MKTLDLNYILDQMNLTTIFRAFHSIVKENTVFSGVLGKLPRIDCIFGHKISLKKFMKIKILSNTYTVHNTMQAKINNRKNCEKSQICEK